MNVTHISQEYMCSWDSDKSISLEIRNETYLSTLIKVLVQKLEIKHTSSWEVYKDQPSLTHLFYLQVHVQPSSLQTSNTPKQTLNPSSVSFSRSPLFSVFRNAIKSAFHLQQTIKLTLMISINNILYAQYLGGGVTFKLIDLFLPWLFPSS